MKDDLSYSDLTCFLTPIHTVNRGVHLEALSASKARRDFHAGYGSKRHWHDAKKGEYADEYYGLLAEVLFRDRVNGLGFAEDFEMPELFTEDRDSIPSWDALLFNKTIEIKAIPPDTDGICRQRLMIKLEEFKKMDFYVAIKFLNAREYIFCGWATGEEIEAAPIHNRGFADAYEIMMRDLHPMRNSWWNGEDSFSLSILTEW